MRPTRRNQVPRYGLAAAVVCSVLLAGCGESPEDTPPTTGDTGEPAAKDSKILSEEKMAEALRALGWGKVKGGKASIQTPAFRIGEEGELDWGYMLNDKHVQTLAGLGVARATFVASMGAMFDDGYNQTDYANRVLACLEK